MKLMAFPAFVACVVISSVLVKRVEPATPNRAACLLYAVQAVLMLAFCLAGVGVSPVVHADSTPVIVCGMIGAAAMGVQNAHGRLVPRPGVPNTVMTGNVTQAVLDTIDILSPQMPSDDERPRERVWGRCCRRLSRSLPEPSQAQSCTGMSGSGHYCCRASCSCGWL